MYNCPLLANNIRLRAVSLVLQISREECTRARASSPSRAFSLAPNSLLISLKNQWKLEVSAIFEAATTISNDTIFLGNLNCDMIEPNKPPMNGRDLCELMDIYNLKNLIISPTRTTEKTTTISISFLQTTRKEYYHRAWLMSKSVITTSYTEF